MPARDNVARRFRYDDRGRGPDLVTIARYDHGFPQSVAVDGVNYAKRPVAERFSVNAARAQWSSSADTGEARPPGTICRTSRTRRTWRRSRGRCCEHRSTR